MPHFISNLYEKNYTPFTAMLAPKNQVHKPVLGRKPQKSTRFGSDPIVRSFWRFVRRWITHNHKLYYTYVILSALVVANFWEYTIVNSYRRNNHHRSLEWAIQKEKEWQLNKPKEEDEEEEEEEEGAEVAEGAEGEAKEAKEEAEESE